MVRGQLIKFTLYSYHNNYPHRQNLNKVVDSDGVARHIGRIADSMTEWEGAIAENLGLTPADVANITTKHHSNLRLQA